MNELSTAGLLEEFKARFPRAGKVQAVRAPGRVNLLGEHTDYNQGFVFPMAIDAGIQIAGELNGTGRVNLYSLNYAAKESFLLEEITPSKSNTWVNYIKGVVWQFQKLGLQPQGADLVIQGNVPQGAGLSSSAALEVAAALLLDALHGWGLGAVDLVKLAQKAENEFVGVACGIMDQFASMLGQKDHALFLDCRSLEYEAVPLPLEKQGYAVAVVNSGVRRGLAGSEYNTRRQQCEEAVQRLQNELPGVESLRDVSLVDLSLVNQLPDPLARRARHVVMENARVQQGVTALKAGELEEFGRLLTASHKSLRDDYEVSCAELDLLVELALEVPGVLGSRMTGAGFGGCTIALVPQTSLPAFEKTVSEEYQRRTGIQPEIFVFRPAPGARIITEADPQS
ncbi:MAG: galactokinase [Limnochordia bacterium]|jgi:galactokinase|nr:galactokinase [Bacillota bacterium]NLL08693.1 galactokinase [Bacillota bacterium]